jgi:hypothetical protein
MNSTLRLFDLQQGKGLIKVNGQPLSLVQPEILRFKVRFTQPHQALFRQPHANGGKHATTRGGTTMILNKMAGGNVLCDESIF